MATTVRATAAIVVDARKLAVLLRTLSESSRPVRSFSETVDPDGASKTHVEFSDGPRQVEKEDDAKPSTDKKGKVPDWQLVTRRSPLFEAGKPQ